MTAVVLLTLCVGNYDTTAADVVKALIDPANHPQVHRIIVLSRVPRLIASAFVGMALSVSGLVYQEIFTNKMASPDILGVSSGAGCGASLAIILGLRFEMTGLFSFAGGLTAVILTMLVSRLFTGGNKSISLILSGIVIGGMMNAFLGLLKYVSNDHQLSTITFWLLGGFFNVTYSQLLVVVPFITAGTAVLYVFRWKILMLKNGDEDAQAHGISAIRIRRLVILVATVITSLSICVSGTVGWIGLAIPNLVRLLTCGQNEQSMPLTIVYGMAFTTFCDLLSRTLTDSEIPVGIITGSVGALLFIIVLIVRKRNDKTGY